MENELAHYPRWMGKSFRFQRTRCDVVLERHTVQKFHHDERLAIVLPNLVDGGDVGVVQSRSRTSLAAETFQCPPVLG